MENLNRRLPETPHPASVSEENILIRQVIGGERIDQIAAEAYGDAAYWRLIAEFNDIADPTRLMPGQILRIPRRACLEVRE